MFSRSSLSPTRPILTILTGRRNGMVASSGIRLRTELADDRVDQFLAERLQFLGRALDDRLGGDLSGVEDAFRLLVGRRSPGLQGAVAGPVRLGPGRLDGGLDFLAGAGQDLLAFGAQLAQPAFPLGLDLLQ